MSYVNKFELQAIIRQALDEDIGKRDITSVVHIPAAKRAKAEIVAKGDFVVCGLSIAAEVFRCQDRSVQFLPVAKEGSRVKKGQVLARVSGKARSILTAERTALNFLSLLCAVATKTRVFCEAVKGYKAKIIDTRKTIPGLRILEKYAVRIGGGFNHRFSLDEMVLIKDNHLQVIGGIEKLMNTSRRFVTEIEVGNLKEFKHALTLMPGIIMLDNMKPAEMRRAVALRNAIKADCVLAPRLEASGGVTLKNIKQIAATGVDLISIGSLTHTIESVDISLEVL